VTPQDEKKVQKYTMVPSSSFHLIAIFEFTKSPLRRGAEKHKSVGEKPAGPFTHSKIWENLAGQRTLA
jgi:hypothetical protein